MTRALLSDATIAPTIQLPLPERSRSGHLRHLSRAHPLARYTDAAGRRRELVTREGAAGSVLLLDRDFATRGDRRLVAHLCGDEPPENAGLVCDDYLRDADMEHRRCRLVTREDATSAPPGDAEESQRAGVLQLANLAAVDTVDGLGNRYRLERVTARLSIPELRWFRRAPVDDVQPEAVSLREVIAQLESYEPMRALTIATVSLARPDEPVSVTTLRAELSRVLESPIVLNRGLRAAVSARVQQGETSMSEIAMRCGRIKRDGRGNVSGETSWLARRMGLLPEGGHSTPTPWIHIDVLALIARDGLGISPREVEI